MEVIFINVGYGDAILLKNDNKYGLLDGGSSLPEEYIGNRISVSEYLKKNNILELEFIILTHIHEDHIGGLVKLLETFKVKTIYLPFIPHVKGLPDLGIINLEKENLILYQKAINMFKSLLFTAEKNSIEIVDLFKLNGIKIFNIYDLVVLEPSEEKLQKYNADLEKIFRLKKDDEIKHLLIKMDNYSNIVSMVLNLKVFDKNIVFAGDNCPNYWRSKTFKYLQNGNVLKLPHHGQYDAVNDKLIKYFNGQIVVTCSSNDKRNNSSDYRIYSRLLNKNKELICLFTDEMDYEPYFRRSHNNSKCVQISVLKDSLTVKCD